MTAPTIDIRAERLPELRGQVYESSGYDGRYRLYTAQDLAFDALPAYGEGGPSIVVLDGWGVSTSSLCGLLSSPSVVAEDDGMHTLGVIRVPFDPADTRPAHPLNGTKYPTKREADRAAYEAGLTGFMVYEKHAALYGLPTEADTE